MNQQVSAQAQERLLSRLSSMGVARPAATALLERHMLVRYRKGAELFSMGSPADVVFAVLTTAGGDGFMPAIIFMTIITLMPAMTPINNNTSAAMTTMRLVVLHFFFSTRVCMRDSPSQ